MRPPPKKVKHNNFILLEVSIDSYALYQVLNSQT